MKQHVVLWTAIVLLAAAFIVAHVYRSSRSPGPYALIPVDDGLAVLNTATGAFEVCGEFRYGEWMCVSDQAMREKLRQQQTP